MAVALVLLESDQSHSIGPIDRMLVVVLWMRGAGQG